MIPCDHLHPKPSAERTQDMTHPKPSLSTSLAAALLAVACAFSSLGCASTSGIQPRGLSSTERPLDLARFMGDWFVIAHIPTALEAEAYDAVETYALREDGRIDVRFRYCDGAADGPAEELHMIGWVHDSATNAEWRVRPAWPLRLAYQILELDSDYRVTVVGHPSGSYAWVMARRPELPEDVLIAIEGRLAAQGYETDRLRRVPHADGQCLEQP